MGKTFLIPFQKAVLVSDCRTQAKKRSAFLARSRQLTIWGQTNNVFVPRLRQQSQQLVHGAEKQEYKKSLTDLHNMLSRPSMFAC
jgi:hypothetical protein